MIIFHLLQEDIKIKVLEKQQLLFVRKSARVYFYFANKMYRQFKVALTEIY